MRKPSRVSARVRRAFSASVMRAWKKGNTSSSSSPHVMPDAGLEGAGALQPGGGAGVGALQLVQEGLDLGVVLEQVAGPFGVDRLQRRIDGGLLLDRVPGQGVGDLRQQRLALARVPVGRGQQPVEQRLDQAVLGLQGLGPVAGGQGRGLGDRLAGLGGGQAGDEAGGAGREGGPGADVTVGEGAHRHRFGLLERVAGGVGRANPPGAPAVPAPRPRDRDRPARGCPGPPLSASGRPTREPSGDPAGRDGATAGAGAIPSGPARAGEERALEQGHGR